MDTPVLVALTGLHTAMLARLLRGGCLQSKVVLGSNVLGGALAGMAEAEVELDTVIHHNGRCRVDAHIHDWPRRSFNEETSRPSLISGGAEIGGVEVARGGGAEHHGVFRASFQHLEMFDKAVPAGQRPVRWNNEKPRVL